MEKVFKPRFLERFKSISYIVTIIMLFVSSISTLIFNYYPPILVSLITIIFSSFSFFLSKRIKYTITDEMLILGGFSESKTIKLSEVKNVENVMITDFLELRSMPRLTGNYKNKIFGEFWFSSTDILFKQTTMSTNLVANMHFVPKYNNYVAITDNMDKKYVITPENPEEFVKAVKK